MRARSLHVFVLVLASLAVLVWLRVRPGGPAPSTSGEVSSPVAPATATTDLDAPRESVDFRREVAPAPKPRSVLRGVVRVLGRSPTEPVRGTIEWAASDPATGGNLPSRAPEDGRAVLSTKGEFAFHGVPNGVLFVHSYVEGAYDGLWVAALAVGEDEKQVEFLVRPMRTVRVTLLQEDGSPLLAETRGPVLRSDLRLEWSRVRPTTAARHDPTHAAELPLGSRLRAGRGRPSHGSSFGADPERDSIPEVFHHFSDEELFACLVLGDRVVAAERLPDVDSTLELRLDGDVLRRCTGGLSVTVVEVDTLSRVVGAEVRVSSEDRGWALLRWTDVDGEATLPHVPFGTHDVQARRCNECPWRATRAVVVPGAAVAHERLVLDGAARILGRVVPGSLGLVGARVECVPAPRGRHDPDAEHEFEGARVVPVRADGTFEIPDVSPEFHALRVVVGDNASQPERIRVGSTIDSRIDLRGP